MLTSRVKVLQSLHFSNFKGITEFHASDLVAVVKSGTDTYDLNQELAQYGLCIPLAPFAEVGPLLGLSTSSVNEIVATGLPHVLESQCGSIRDWVLGMTLVLADGTIAQTGSNAVKNVAGFDAHKLMVGSWGTLAVVVEVIFKLRPISQLPRPILTGDAGLNLPEDNQHLLVIHRTRPEDFRELRATIDGQCVFDEAGHTAWYWHDQNTPVHRFPHDWVMKSGESPPATPQLEKLMRKAKAIFDPTNKLNAGLWGFM